MALAEPLKIIAMPLPGVFKGVVGMCNRVGKCEGSQGRAELVSSMDEG